ncbi:MAG: glycoside hydrolase family 13 protein [Oscillospiraceae bacterium]|jgi:cyclomaltodextrinase|nr:glycoside hydrolase family 13 protein [Oscillospiraceae bacterium]
MFPVFDPRDAACKSPFGAVACGAEVSFTLRDGDYYACELLVHREFAGVDEVCPLPPAEGGFSGIYTAPQEPDLCWYAFRFTRADGSTVCYGRSGWCGQDALARWQLTVYEDTPTPAWFGQGVTYQIFPDRFRRTSVPDVGGMVGRRWVHDNWSDQPVFLPDEQGQITNRDFFGGSLAGITEKLDYLKSLSVSTLYLNPIFEADSNHRYNTADYHAIDPLLGSEEDFRTLCREAHARGIHIILDGVFNHTGSNSRYFNAEGFYPEPGAAQSTESPYFNWYSFHPWPTDYDAWWGVHTLPAVNEEQPDYRRFIISGKNSVVRHWLRDGADGWRLDVADELPDDFIAAIRDAIQAEKPNGYLLGEVWEDGSNKIAYSRRRRYLLGRETHGLMNYPFRTALLAWLGGGDAAAFRDDMETIRENYPPAAFYGAMNFLGTHDTPRILTLLGVEQTPEDKGQRAAYRLSPAELARGQKKLRLAAMLLYSFPGSPTLYYGDEAGMQGFEDPLNRGTYPWGGEDGSLLAFFRRLGQLRAERISMQCGIIRYLHAQGGGLVVERLHGTERTVTALNAGDTPLELTLPWDGRLCIDAVTGQQFLSQNGTVHLTLPPLDGVILV